MKNYKNALYYLEKTNPVDYPKYTPMEKMMINKILENVKDVKLDFIISNVINLKLKLAIRFLREYIEEEEKQNDKED